MAHYLLTAITLFCCNANLCDCYSIIVALQRVGKKVHPDFLWWNKLQTMSMTCNWHSLQKEQQFCFLLLYCAVLTSAPYSVLFIYCNIMGILTTAYLDGILRTFLIFFVVWSITKLFISSTFYDTSPLYSFQISYFRVRQLQNARCMYHH